MAGVKVWWVMSAAFLLLMVPRINSWGKEGHFAICKIAQEYLTEEALKAVKDLLPSEAEGDLANVCDWADQVRYRAHYGWSKTLHYVDTADFLCNYKYSRALVIPVTLMQWVSWLQTKGSQWKLLLSHEGSTLRGKQGNSLLLKLKLFVTKKMGICLNNKLISSVL